MAGLLLPSGLIEAAVQDSVYQRQDQQGLENRMKQSVLLMHGRENDITYTHARKECEEKVCTQLGCVLWATDTCCS